MCKRNFKLFLGVILLISIILTSSVVSAQTLVFEENFDSYAEGALPTQFNSSYSAEGNIIKVEASSALYGTTGKGLTFQQIKGTTMLNTTFAPLKNFSIEFNYRCNSDPITNTEYRFYVHMAGHPNAYVTPTKSYPILRFFQVRNYMTFRDLTNGEFPVTLFPNEMIPQKWYNVKFVFDWDSSSYDAYIDGEKMVDKMPMRQIECTGFSISGTNDNANNISIDEIKIYDLTPAPVATPAPTVTQAPVATSAPVATPAPVAPKTDDSSMVIITLLIVMSSAFIILRKKLQTK